MADTIDWALRVVEAIAFGLHSVIGLTEPCHGVMTALTEDSLPCSKLFFPVAGLCLAGVVGMNFSGIEVLVLLAQDYVAAFHTGGIAAAPRTLACRTAFN